LVQAADRFDIDVYLAQPLVARVAAAGPSVRAIWFLWEQGCFWWLTGSWARLPAILTEDPRVALVVDTCDLGSGVVRQVSASGDAELRPFDPDRARRKLVRYLGADEQAWDPRFQIEAMALDQATRFVRLSPQRLIARDLSFRPAG
jgi:Pyridoxamine 5'-phosphate oxidase